jgi:hypothetical protein
VRLQHGDDHDIRQLVERGSADWSGPSPAASQSRWADAAADRRRGPAARLVVGLGFAAVVLGAVAIVATGQPANGPAASVTRIVSRALAGSLATPAARLASPAPSVSLSPRPTRPASAAGAGPAATPRATPRPVPSPTRSDDGGGDDHRPSPSPTPGGSPSPRPSPTDD